jgi:hypothetical protein
MALSTTDTIAIYENAADSAAIKLRDPDLKVEILATDAPVYTGVLTCYDSSGNVTGSQAFVIPSADLVTEEAGFVAAMATVKAAFEKAVKTRVLAIPANSGLTITYS